jgi:predicted N-acyltransferase
MPSVFSWLEKPSKLMNTRILHSIREIDATEWNSIVGRNHLICRHEYLRAVEESGINDCRYFYPVVYDNSKLVAHTCVYFITTDLDTFADSVTQWIARRIRSAWEHFLVLRSVECGTPVALGNTLSFASASHIASTLPILMTSVENLAEDQRAGFVVFRDFYETEVAYDPYFRATGYTKVPNLPCASLKIRWQNFDDYLNAMRSEYRCKILSQKRRFEGHAAMDFILDFAPYSDSLAMLWRNCYERAREYRREVLNKCFFSKLVECIPANSALILASKDNKPIGFLLLLFDDGKMTTLFSGLDYSCSRTYCTYFNLFYKAIEVAIQKGIEEIDFGITTLAPKMDLGAVVTPLFMHMKHMNPLLNTFVPRLFAAMTSQKHPLSRNVLKAG